MTFGGGSCRGGIKSRRVGGRPIASPCATGLSTRLRCGDVDEASGGFCGFCAGGDRAGWYIRRACAGSGWCRWFARERLVGM